MFVAWFYILDLFFCLSSVFFRVLLTCFFSGRFVFVVDFLTIAGGFFLI